MFLRPLCVGALQMHTIVRCCHSGAACETSLCRCAAVTKSALLLCGKPQNSHRFPSAASDGAFHSLISVKLQALCEEIVVCHSSHTNFQPTSICFKHGIKYVSCMLFAFWRTACCSSVLTEYPKSYSVCCEMAQTDAKMLVKWAWSLSFDSFCTRFYFL